MATGLSASLETRPSPSSAIIITLTFEPYRSYGLDDFRKFAHVIRGTPTGADPGLTVGGCYYTVYCAR